MSRERLDAARELLREKRYDEARVILEDVDHPMARKWLRQLDATSPHQRQSSGLGGLVVTLLVSVAALLIGVIIGAVAFPRTVTVQETMVGTEVAELTIMTEIIPAPSPFFTITPQPTLMPLPTATPLPSTSSRDTQGWYLLENVSIMDDTTTVGIIRDADMPVNTWLSTVTPYLAIRCRASLLEIYIDVETSFDMDVELDDTVFVQIRWENEAATVVRMEESSSGEAVFFDDAHATLRRMAQYDRLVFGFTPFNTTQQATTFTFAGLDQAIQPIIEACNLPAFGS